MSNDVPSYIEIMGKSRALFFNAMGMPVVIGVWYVVLILCIDVRTSGKLTWLVLATQTVAIPWCAIVMARAANEIEAMCKARYKK